MSAEPDGSRTWDFTSLLHILRLDEEHGLSLSFVVGDDDTSVTVFINCSDLFYWACGDAEEITPGDLPDIEQAIADLVPLPDHAHCRSGELFCCRRRGMRPQGPWYGYTDTQTGKVRRRFVSVAVEAAFDACGPERTDAPKPPRPADGRRWDYGGSVEPPDFVDHFKPGGKFGP